MGKVLKFRTKEQRRIIDVLAQLTDDEVLGNLSLLRSGCVMQYYRFGPPILQLNSTHIDLVLEEVGRRGLVKNQPFMKGWDGLVVSDAFSGNLEAPEPTPTSFTVDWSNHPVREDRDPWIPQYTPITLENLPNGAQKEPSPPQAKEEWPSEW